jgi:hypothetical protein
MKSLNNLVVIVWHTPWKCVRVLIGTMSIRLSKDNHDSRGTCTTSTVCKTIITAVLTVMSNINPHLISDTWDGFWLSFGWVMSKWALLGCGSIMVRLRGAIEIIIFEVISWLPYY